MTEIPQTTPKATENRVFYQFHSIQSVNNNRS
jgi:hypothetical protein